MADRSECRPYYCRLHCVAVLLCAVCAFVCRRRFIEPYLLLLLHRSTSSGD